MKEYRKEKLESIGFAWQGLKGARKKNTTRKAAPPLSAAEEVIQQHEEDAFDFQQMNVARGAALFTPDAANNQPNFNDNAMMARLSGERGNLPGGMPPNNQANFNDNAMLARLNIQRAAPPGGEMMNNQAMLNNSHSGMMNNQGNFNDNAVLARLNAERPGGMPNNPSAPGFSENAVLARLNAERRPAPGDIMNNQPPPPGFNENQVDRYAYQQLLQFARPGARFYG